MGTHHPLNVVRKEIIGIFERLGFTISEGPEIEDDYHVFSGLNFPEEHPARDMQDTFFVDRVPDLLLRTHTSSVQVREMEQHDPPMRLIMPGRVFRNEAISARAHCMFHQIEGLYIDEDVSFADLKQTLLLFAQEFFGPDTKIRDMKGKTILPGFVNNHHHPQGSTEDIAREMFELPGALVGYYINLIVAPTADETLSKVAQAVGMLQERMEVKPTDWIGIELFPDGDVFPDLGSVSFLMSAPLDADAPIGTDQLSEIIPGNPAVLMSGGGIHISRRDPGVWYHVSQAVNGEPIIEELFTFEF